MKHEDIILKDSAYEEFVSKLSPKNIKLFNSECKKNIWTLKIVKRVRFHLKEVV